MSSFGVPGPRRCTGRIGLQAAEMRRGGRPFRAIAEYFGSTTTRPRRPFGGSTVSCDIEFGDPIRRRRPSPRSDSHPSLHTALRCRRRCRDAGGDLIVLRPGHPRLLGRLDRREDREMLRRSALAVL